MSEENKSVGWVIGMPALAVAYAGWAYLAAQYHQNADLAGDERANFFVNSVTQLPNLVSVIRYGFSERLRMIIATGLLEVGVLVIGVVMKKLEGELDGKRRGKSSARR